MSENGTPAAPKAWHVASWPPLAWLETIIKLVAFGFGIAALVRALATGTFELPGGLHLFQLIVLFVLSLGLVAAILDRWIEREIVAMVFVILNNVAHWGMVIALLFQPGPGWLLLAFAGLVLLGDLVKLVFLRAHTDFTVRNTPRIALYGLTGVYVTGYSMILLLELIL
ncbi:MAG: hypothetical protein PVI09_12340 [Anaerolineae bacterium]|jgi:hypothetical protein